MQTNHDMLEAVVAELRRRSGDLRAVANAAGMSYDTVHRVKRKENDPGYSKVARLAEVLGLRFEIAADGGDGN